LYVILGILLLFFIGTYIYVRGQTTKQELDTSLKQALDQDEPRKFIARHVGSAVKAALSKTKRLLDPTAKLFAATTLLPKLPSLDEVEEPSSEEKLEEKSPCDTQHLEPPKPPEISFDEFPHTYLGDRYVYYFNMGGVENIPTLEQFGEMFSEKIRQDLDTITKQLPNDLTQDYQVLSDYAKVQTILTNDAIQTKISLPICVEGQIHWETVSPVKIKSNFAQMLNFAKWIVQQDINHPEYLDVSALEDEAERNTMKVSIIEEEDARTYSLIDMDPDADQSHLLLSFVSIL